MSENFENLIPELGIKLDKEIALKTGLPRRTVTYRRRKLGIEAAKKLTKAQKVIEYLKINCECIIIEELIKHVGFSRLGNKNLTKKYLKNLAKKNNIKILFSDDNKFTINSYIHNSTIYNKGLCYCEICKLTRCIYAKFKRTHNIKLSNKHTSYYANEHFHLYKLSKEEFYKFVEQDLIKENILTDLPKKSEISVDVAGGTVLW